MTNLINERSRGGCQPEAAAKEWEEERDSRWESAINEENAHVRSWTLGFPFWVRLRAVGGFGLKHDKITLVL